METATVESIDDGGDRVTASVLLSYADGTTETLEVELSYEGGEYRRHLTQEEVSYLNDLYAQ